MDIVSVVNDSFQEYENRQSLVLFCASCNLRCEYCYNLKQILSGEVIGSAIEVMEKRLTPMHQAVVFLGGEPTLWADSLVESAQFVKNMGLEAKLYTNGMYPRVLKQLLCKRLIDAVSVDFKCIDNCKEVLGVEIDIIDYLSLLNETIFSVLDSNVDVEIRTTTCNGLIDIDLVKTFVKCCYPGVRHIVQKDFRSMLPS